PATKNEPPGWTSPTGRHYQSEHQDWEPPQWPRHVVPELGSLERVVAGCADLVRIGYSPGEAWLDRILHPPSA
ncbi:endonuclease, partial [Pseudarthrobacter sp. C4D7]|nr:endonuclease [Pseudarthrobacter sp. C4D7]